MKRLTFFLVIFFLFLPCISAEDRLSNDEAFAEAEPENAADIEIIIKYEDVFDDKKKKRLIQERMFEIGFGVGFKFSNDVLSVSEILKKTIYLNLDDLSKGLELDLGANIPWHLSLNFGKWGIGLFSGLDLSGAAGIHRDIFALNYADNAQSDLNASVFAYLGADSFFHIKKFKVKIKPSLFYPLAYVVPVNDKIYYKYTSDGAAKLEAGYDFRVYTATSMETFPDFDLSAKPGFDLSAGVEYPLSEAIGLNKRFPILDFDVGLDFINIPVVPSKMKEYIAVTGKFSFTQQGTGELSEILKGDVDSERYINYRDDGDESVRRAFKMLIWANWRPFSGSRVFTVTPVIGFSVNTLFFKAAAVEAGLTARLSLANLFIVTAGISYDDRAWRNSLDLGFNFRAFQFNIGAALRSPDFIGSWTVKGADINLGFKIGW